jgi:coenzyme F420-reducing hydrogenase delta subunit
MGGCGGGGLKPWFPGTFVQTLGAALRGRKPSPFTPGSAQRFDNLAKFPSYPLGNLHWPSQVPSQADNGEYFTGILNFGYEWVFALELRPFAVQNSLDSGFLQASGSEGSQSANPADHGSGLPDVKEASCAEGTDLVVVAFACSYCAYTAADLAGALRLSYPPEVRIIQVPCTGRVDAGLLLQAFAEGADAVFVAGCNLGDCHFVDGNRRAKEEVARCQKLLAEVGLEAQRLEFFHIPASAGQLFAQRAREMVERAKTLGSNPLRRTSTESYGGKIPFPDLHGRVIVSQQFGRLFTHEDRTLLSEHPEGTSE